MWPKAQRIVLRAQWWSGPATAILLVLVGAHVENAWLMVGLAIFSPLIILFLAIPPLTARHVGRVRAASDVTVAYAISTFLVWLAVLAFSLDLATASDAVAASFVNVTPWLRFAPVVAWLAQLVCAVDSRRLRHRAMPGDGDQVVDVTEPDPET